MKELIFNYLDTSYQWNNGVFYLKTRNNKPLKASLYFLMKQLCVIFSITETQAKDFINEKYNEFFDIEAMWNMINDLKIIEIQVNDIKTYEFSKSRKFPSLKNKALSSEFSSILKFIKYERSRL